MDIEHPTPNLYLKKEILEYLEAQESIKLELDKKAAAPSQPDLESPRKISYSFFTEKEEQRLNPSTCTHSIDIQEVLQSS